MKMEREIKKYSGLPEYSGNGFGYTFPCVFLYAEMA